MARYTVTIMGDGEMPLWMCVNGKELAIPKGIPVEVDEEFYYALRNIARQRASAKNLLKLYVEKTDHEWKGDGRTLDGIKPTNPKLRKGAPLKMD